MPVGRGLASPPLPPLPPSPGRLSRNSRTRSRPQEFPRASHRPVLPRPPLSVPPRAPVGGRGGSLLRPAEPEHRRCDKGRPYSASLHRLCAEPRLRCPRVVNLYAYVATEPAELRRSGYPGARQRPAHRGGRAGVRARGPGAGLARGPGWRDRRRYWGCWRMGVEPHRQRLTASATRSITAPSLQEPANRDPCA